MKIVLQHLGIRSSDNVDAAIERALLAMEERQTIEEARVVLERRRQTSPPFVVRVHLVVPGKDIRDVAQDQTLAAAALNVVRQLERMLAVRERRRLARAKSNLQITTAKARGW